MTGTIVSYEKSFDEGLILAEDGHNYHFKKSDFLKKTSINPTLEVDFTPDQVGFATQIKSLSTKKQSSLFTAKGCISQKSYLIFLLISIIVQALFAFVLLAFIIEDLSTNVFIDGHLKHNQSVNELSMMFLMMKDIVDAGLVFFIYIILLSFNFFLLLLACIKRLHDMNLSGFWVLIGFMPFGIFVLLTVCLVGPTTRLNNRFCKG